MKQKKEIWDPFVNLYRRNKPDKKVWNFFPPQFYSKNEIKLFIRAKLLVECNICSSNSIPSIVLMSFGKIFYCMKYKNMLLEWKHLSFFICFFWDVRRPFEKFSFISLNIFQFIPSFFYLSVTSLTQGSILQIFFGL